MATDLEIRVTAELSQIKASLAQLTTSIDTVNAKANAGGKASAGLATGLGKAAGQAKQAAGASDKMADSINRAKSSMAGFLAGIGLVAVVKNLVTMADTYTRLTGQLKLATQGTSELNRAQSETFAIAQRTRQGLEATVNLYARIARAGKTSQEGTLQLTESINQAVSLSFTSASAGEAALFQLGQALASGTLRGDELNSVLEQTPRLAQAIADGLVKLGKIKDPGGLRAYAQANGIAAADVIAAIQSQRDKLTDEFSKLTPTVADAFTALRNAVLQFVGDTNSASGATQSLAKYILVLANNVDTIAAGLILAAKLWLAYKVAVVGIPAIVNLFAASATAAGAASAEAAVGVGALAASETAAGAAAAGAAGKVTLLSTQINAAGLKAIGLSGILKGLGGVLAAGFAGWEFGTFLVNQFVVVQKAGIVMAKVIHTSLVEMGGAAKAIWLEIANAAKRQFNAVIGFAADAAEKMGNLVARLPGGDRIADKYQAAADKLRSSQKATEDFGDAWKRIDAETKASVAAIGASYDVLLDNAGKTNETVKSTATAGPPANGGTTAKGIKAIADQYALMKDAAERSLRQIDQLYADNMISIRKYYAEKTRLQQASIDADIAAAQADLAKARAEAAKAPASNGTAQGADASKQATKAVGDALTKIITLERARRDVALQSAHDQAQAEQDLADKLAGVHAALLEAQGQGAAAKTIELEVQYRDLLRRLEAESDTAGKAMVEKLINVEAAKAGLDQFKKEFSDATSALSQLEATTSAQVSAGLLSNATAEKRVKEARDATLQQLKDQRTAVADLYTQYKDPATLQYMQQLDQQIAELSVSTEDWRGKLQDASVDALTTFFKDLSSGAMSAGEAVANLARNFTASLAAMAAQALAKKAIGAIFDLFAQDQGADDGGASQVATAAAAGLAYSVPVTTAATALSLAGGVVSAGAGAITVAAAALQAAATTLLIANAASSASVAHTGGVVGSLGNMRNVPSWMYAGAPRYHSGGIAGLRSDEVPAVLKRNEEVLTRNDPRHRYNGGLAQSDAGAQKPMRFIFLDDQRKVKDYLTSPEGEQVHLEVLSRNAGAVREILKG